MVMTTDGFIAKDNASPSTAWTSGADKKIFVQRTKEAGAIIMGLTTYQTINKPLPGRLNVILTHYPEKEQSIPGQLEFTDKPARELLQELESRGYKEVILGGGATVNSLFLKEGLIDELQITIEPTLFGGGLTLFQNLNLNEKLELLELNKLDGDVINVRYKIKKPAS